MERKMKNHNIVALPCKTDADWILRISAIAHQSGNVLFTHHAKQRLAERDLTRKQVLTVLQNGTFAEFPAKSVKGNWEFRMRYHICGEMISVAAALDANAKGETIIVITAYFGD